MITTFTTEYSEKWDSVVKTFRDTDVYWLSGYVKAFEIHGDGKAILFYYDDGSVRAINVVMKRDIATDTRFKGKIPENTYFDLATPYGYGGWLIEGTDKASLFDEYEKWCFENNIISEFVRFHPVIGNHAGVEEYYNVIKLGHTVAMNLETDEVIWDNLTSKNRNMIRKAQKNNIEIRSENSAEIYGKFIEIYNGTMDKDKADSYYYFKREFYDSILNDLPGNSQVFYAVLEEKVIATSIMLWENGRMNYHLSGSLREYSSLAPSNLLLYEAARWGCANGCKTLHLGGGVGSGEDSLFKFKKAFYRGDDLINTFCIGKKVFNKDKYDELVNIRSDIKNRSFFPEYRG